MLVMMRIRMMVRIRMGGDDDGHMTVDTLCICFIFPGYNCLEGKDNFIYTFWNSSQNLGSTVYLVGIQ